MKTITFDETKWKLVPVQPTREMLMAALDADNASYDNHQYVLTEQWKDMLAAAPSQPMGDEEKQTLVYEKLLACLQCGDTSQPAVLQGDPVLVQHRKPVVGKDGETVGYTSWIDGSGLDWWPHRTLYAAPSHAGKCAQCHKPYRKGANTKGCPKCAPGVDVPESEFQKPISAPSQEPAVPSGLQWFTVAEHGIPEIGAEVIGGLWYTDPWLKPEFATTFMWGQCRVLENKGRDFKDGKKWHTFGPSHNQITHWARINKPGGVSEPSQPVTPPYHRDIWGISHAIACINQAVQREKIIETNC